MVNLRSHAGLATALLAFTAAMAPLAQGRVIFSSNFDPFEFQGNGMIVADDECLGAPNSWVANAGAGAVGDAVPGCGITLQSLTAQLYAPGDNAHANLLGTLTFPPTSANPPVLGLFTGNVFNPGDGTYDMAGFDLAPYGPVFATVPGSAPPPLTAFWIEYVSGFAGDGEGIDGFPLGIVNLYEAPCQLVFVGESQVRFCSGRPDTPTEFAAVLDFTRVGRTVPEPGSLALLAGGLLAGWGAARRRLRA